MVLIVGPVFLLLAAWFLWGPDLVDRPLAASASVSRADVSTAPLRTPATDPPMLLVAGTPKRCNDCHMLFTSVPNTPVRLNQHQNIEQGHGMNDRCFNCHDTESHNSLILPGGELILFADAVRLCATCHGTTFRDWERGMHGRTNGYWDTSRGEQIRLTCTQCHDPHAPAIGLMTALPGPHTLRLDRTPPDRPAGDHGKHNPLRRWSGAAHAGEVHD